MTVVLGLPTAPESTTPEPLLLRVGEAAVLLGVSRSKLYELLHSGEVPSIRVGSSLRVPRRHLLSWIEEKTADSGAVEPAVRKEARTSGQLAT